MKLIRLLIFLPLFLILQVAGFSQTWFNLNSGLNMSTIRGVATSPSVTVVVGANGQVAIRDKLTGVWTTRKFESDNQFYGYNDVLYANGQFIVVGDYSRIRKSSDGHTWTSLSLINDGFRSIIWSGTQYVMVGSSSRVLTSLDGTTWTSRLSGNGLDFASVAFSGVRYVAVGNSGMRISNNAITWTIPTNAPTSINFTECTWTGTRFIAIGWNPIGSSYVTYSSSDGDSWSMINTTRDGSVESVLSVSGITYITGSKGPGYGFVRKSSDDGVTWKEIYLDSNGTESFTDLAFDGEALVVVGYNSNVWSANLSSIPLHEPPDLGIHVLPSRAVELKLKTRWGKRHQTQVSTDLIFWTDFGNAISGNGQMKAVSENAGTDLSRFYRVATTPETIGNGELKILEARYGGAGVSANVKTIVESKIVGDTLTIQASNTAMGGDPIVGYFKALLVRYMNSSGVYEAVVRESGIITIPDSSHTRLD